LAPQLRALGGLLGLLQRDANDFLQGGKADAWVVERIAAREAARKRRDFAAADGIRKELLDQGVVLEDGAKGTTWRRA
ncbi:MAG: cysteine--tRNA ligase, partial [Pseudomonadota bacterium]|nr:cysteine--tRNA ligase [Pseudomonadota bacterium]